MSGHPSKLVVFRAWAKAMELGATVDKPHYGQTRSGRKRVRRRRLRKRKSPRPQKD